jgi:hypothetical protein
MSEWEPLPYKDYKWILADPALLGGKLAVRGTRLSVFFLLFCFGRDFHDLGNRFRRERSGSTCRMWLLDANVPAKPSLLLEEFSIEAATAQSEDGVP